MTKSPVRFIASDAHLLAAATQRRPGGRRRKLRDLLHGYDWLNRDLPTYDDLNYGLARLVAGGFVKVQKGSSGITVSPTAAGMRLGRSAREGARTLGEVGLRMESLLGCAPHPGEEVELRSLGGLKGFERADFDSAMQAYRDSFERYSRPVMVVSGVFRRVLTRLRPDDYA